MTWIWLTCLTEDGQNDDYGGGGGDFDGGDF
jgi:hypothetical protein